MRERGVADTTSRIGTVSTTGLCYRMLRRLRGVVLRFVRRRRLAVVVGLALALPAAWVEFSGRIETWWIEGLALVVGATGVALAWTGFTGAAPDWIEEPRR